MNKVFLKTPTALLAGMALLATTACTDRNELSDGGLGEDGKVKFAFKGVPYQASSQEGSEMLSQVKVYHFKEDTYFLTTDVEDPYA